MTKKYNFISALRVLHLDHNKKKFFVFISVLRSLHGISGKKIHYICDHEYFFLRCYYVHYIVTMIKNKYFYFSTTFTTAWLRKNIFQFEFQHYVHHALITTENIFISNLTLVPLHYKFSISIKFVDVTVISPSEISLESYMTFFFLRKVQCFCKICRCDSNFTIVISSSEILVKSYMLYYPFFFSRDNSNAFAYVLKTHFRLLSFFDVFIKSIDFRMHF